MSSSDAGGFRCVACTTELPAGAAFCHRCGAEQAARACRSCGQQLVAGARFCSACGTPVAGAAVAEQPSEPPPAAERRLTSVLFADLVGSTQFAESRDSEDVRDLLTAYFESCRTIVGRYGGTIEKFIGDAVMAVWGVPSAHEDDAERAVRAAIELIDGVAELGATLGVPAMVLRAGVVTGEVAATVGATGQGMVAGDPVNTAARVQAAAGPGQVWVDGATRALTAAAIDYVDLGEHTLKGKAEPVRLFHAGPVIASLGGRHRVDGLEAPLTGRDRELRLLKELFHATEESARPRLVVLDGAAGTGKSRLTWELEKYVDGLNTEVRWHRGRCIGYVDGVAFWALAEAVRGRLGLLDGASEESMADAVDRTLDAYVADKSERDWLRPRLASLLGETAVDVHREDLFSAWTRFFERVGGGDHPVGLVIEDGQYADGGLLDFVEHLVGNARIPLFVLLVARPELLAERPDLGGRRSTVVRLDPIADDVMCELVDRLVDGLPAAARQALAKRSEGIPLYAVEMTRALIDNDLVQPREGRYVVADPAKLDIDAMSAPPSLHALVAARLDALARDERRVVADASVLGMSFRADEVLALTGGAVAGVTDVIASLQRKEILAAADEPFTGERGGYRFVQSVVRQIAYGTLSRRDRKIRHLRAAAHLAAQPDRADELAAVIAQHLLDAVDAAGPHDDDVAELQKRAADLLGKAGTRACSLCSFNDGLRLLESALARIGDGPDRAELQEQAAQAAMALGRWEVAGQLADAALQVRDAAGPLDSANAAALKASAMMCLGRHAAARDLLHDRYTALEGLSGVESARLELALPLGRTLAQLGDHAAARVVQEEALRLAEQLEDAPRIADAMITGAVDQMARGSTRVAFAMLRDAVELSGEHGLWDTLARAHNNLAVFGMAYSAADCLANGEAGLRVARDHGEHGTAEWVTGNLCVGLWHAGSWSRLAELMHDYFDVSDDHDPFSLAMLRTIDLWRERAGLNRITSQPPSFDNDSLSGRSWQEHVRLLLATAAGDRQAAAGHARRSVELALRDKLLKDDFGTLWPPAVRAALAAADYRLAADLIAPVAEAPRGQVTPLLAAHLHVLRAALAAAQDGEPVSVETGFRSGIDAFEAYGAPPMRAQAEEELGGWLLRAGRPADAQPLLAAARATYADLGATRWLRRLDAQRPSGATLGPPTR